MKNLLALLFAICVYHPANSQKIDTLPSAWAITIKQLLAIPANYEVISFELAINNKMEIFKVQNYGAALNARAIGLIDQVLPGSKIYFDNVLVEKDGKKLKWMGKAFVVQ